MNFIQMGIYAIASLKWAMVQVFTPSESVIVFFLKRFTCAGNNLSERWCF